MSASNSQSFHFLKTYIMRGRKIQHLNRSFMNPPKMIEIRLYRLPAVLVFLLCFILLFPKVQYQPFETREVFAKLSIMGEDKKLSGVTGSLFSGESTRSFHGNMFFEGREWESTNDEVPAGQFNEAGPRKWAVCITIHSPTQAILEFVDFEEWAIVIVGDKGMSPFHVKGTHAFSLNVAEQEALAQKFSQLSARLPWNHFSPENMGYFFVILHGAESRSSGLTLNVMLFAFGRIYDRYSVL